MAGMMFLDSMSVGVCDFKTRTAMMGLGRVYTDLVANGMVFLAPKGTLKNYVSRGGAENQYSIQSTLNSRIKPMKFDAGIIGA
ncbi:MAG: hypothetical protein LBC18_01245 [Opitutaceae bacterium]|jgi:hypothetical protein|nr:hypothetical protein [Opitutaceae bacterium]